MPVPGGFPFVQPIPPLLEHAYAAFGPSRMMWGSDFPPVSFREGYHNALRFAAVHIPLAGPEDRAYLLGRTALR